MTTKTDIKLLPCPFCGGDAEMDTRQGYLALGTGRPGNRIAVYCQHCDADMGVCIEDVPDITPEQVAEMWNRRAAVEADRQGRMPHRCEDCPPVGYPTDKTRCAPCDRRAAPVVQEPYRDIPENGYEFRKQAASAEPGEAEALRDMLDNARSDLEMLRNALGVPVEPHQNLLERMLDAAKVAAPIVQESTVDESVIRFYKKLFTCERADAERYRWSISTEENADSLKNAVITYTGDRVMINRKIDERRTGK